MRFAGSFHATPGVVNLATQQARLALTG